MTVSASRGTPAGTGDARCATWLQPAVASAQPASASRSASKTFSRVSPTGSNASNRRNAASRARLRSVVWTVQPSAISWRIRKPAM